MINTDGMNGNFLGGGVLKHVVKEGEIYLNADQLSGILMATGYRMMVTAKHLNDPGAAAAAYFTLILSEQMDELRSELLKREAETSL